MRAAAVPACGDAREVDGFDRREAPSDPAPHFSLDLTVALIFDDAAGA